MSRPTQRQFYRSANVEGLLLFVMTYLATITGEWAFAGCGILLLTIGIVLSLVTRYEKDPETGKARQLYHCNQSYLFMAGPFIFTPLIVLTAQAWHDYGKTLPPWAQSWLWVFVGFGLVWLSGIVFRAADNGRYIEQGKSILKSPSKWWIDHWQMPACITLVVMTVFPTWWMPNPHQSWINLLLGICVVLGICDHLRRFRLRRQHVRWNEETFEVDKS